jgi:carbohydrate kinase (thermoresistant glucokinase family)
VTGATGSLGAHIVAQLITSEGINKVYCLIRAKNNSEALERLNKSLIKRRLYHTLTLPARQKLVAVASDLSDARLGITKSFYEEISSSISAIIHCAWSVNFNMQLSSFEKSNIAGVANLIALCQATVNTVRSIPAASFNFCSSVSTVSRTTVVPVPESLPQLNWAQGMGYGQSKSVAEHICARAAKTAGLRTRVIRIGQIVADTQHGVWNSTEAVPMMIQTALTVGALPRLQETPSWLPVDTVAQAVIDISFSQAESVFTNLTNPNHFSWTDDLLPALRCAGLEFEEVTPKEWVKLLRNSNQDPVANPPIKLADFFASKYDKDIFHPSTTYETSVACALSPALALAPLLDQKLVDRFIQYFRSQDWKEKNCSSEPKRTVVIIAGPCGCGKTTLSTAISTWLRVPFIEGDSLHCKAAVEKMAQMIALTDLDREDWLKRVGHHAREVVVDLDYDSVVVSCSALKRKYRDSLRRIITENQDQIRTVFIDLQCSPETLYERVRGRVGHYMTENMVESQITSYEAAGIDEYDVLPIDSEASQEEVLSQAIWILGLKSL